MPGSHQQAPYIGSPALGTKSPPLSKYFQTPAGRSSPIALNGPGEPRTLGTQSRLLTVLSEGNLMLSGSSESLPSLPPRPLASPSSARWDQDSPQKSETVMQRYPPGTPLSAPFAGQSQLASHNPQHYGSIRGGPNSPLGPPRAPNVNLGSHPDTSKWGIKNNHGYSRSQDQRSPPSLPVSVFDTFITRRH